MSVQFLTVARAILADVCDGHLMGLPETLQEFVVKLPRCRPTFGTPEDNHGPPGPDRRPTGCRLLLVLLDIVHTLFQGRRHGLMHRIDVISFHKVGLPAVVNKETISIGRTPCPIDASSPTPVLSLRPVGAGC